MGEVRVKAYAKVNLALEVLGRRSDGYHEVRTILQTIDLADDVRLAPSEEMFLEVSPRAPAPPEEDLAMRAARALRQATGHSGGANIRLVKRIPEAAGLGGGSADAAAVLVGLNRLWGLGLSPERLAHLAASLGSDVPFFVCGGTALATGRGEVLTPLPSLEGRWLTFLAPPLSGLSVGGRGKTGHLYSLLGPEHYTDGTRTALMAEALRAGRAPDDLVYNVFEAVAERAFPGLAKYQQALREAGARAVHMAGSGPALFSLSATGEEAGQVHAALRRRGYAASLARAVGPRAVDEFM